MNVAARLVASAKEWPNAPAVIVPEREKCAPFGSLDRQECLPHGANADGTFRYRRYSFRELNDDSDRIARGLAAMGVLPGTRLALMVRPGFDFISLTFALFKAGAVSILIDPGMGRRNVLRCLDEVEPQGFIAIPLVQAIRTLLRRRYPLARFNVTAGRRWFWGGVTLAQLRAQASGGCDMASWGRDMASGGRQPPDDSRQTQIDQGADAPRSPVPRSPCDVTADDPAAIIFTSGATGPPKGVLYRHGNFARQVDEIRDFYGIQSGEIDVACFPLFALFNCAMGVTTVVPRMDFSRPATVDPCNIIGPINDLNATQAFASPAVWDRVGRYCERHDVRLPSLRRVLSAGAPVPAEVLRRMKERIHPEGDVHTPYGATEALPVASIAASEVLGETAAQTRLGAGVCVGRRFPGIEWKVIRIVDGPIPSLGEAEELPQSSRHAPRAVTKNTEEDAAHEVSQPDGHNGGGAPQACATRSVPATLAATLAGSVGELIVRGPVVTREYYRRPQANALGKIADGPSVWHRLGDVGYLDAQGRFWFCGRLAHRVMTAAGPMYTIPCEAIFNCHPDVYRSALVGVEPQRPQTMGIETPETQTPVIQTPVIIVQPEEGRFPRTPADRARLIGELRQLAAGNQLTSQIEHFLIHPSFPVDIRHNAKIFREKLAAWAAGCGAMSSTAATDRG